MHKAPLPGLLFVAVLMAGPAAPGFAQASPSPIVADCADPRLPAELLDGNVAAPSSPLPVVTATAPHVRLRLAVAADPATRETGLMCVLRLRPRTGMIFVFPNTDRWDFWMKNTLAPLDMIWLNGGGTITTVAANVPASTRSTPNSRVATRQGAGRFVIELRAGEAALDNLTVGTRLLLPPLEVRSQ